MFRSIVIILLRLFLFICPFLRSLMLILIGYFYIFYNIQTCDGDQGRSFIPALEWILQHTGALCVALDDSKNSKNSKILITEWSSNPDPSHSFSDNNPYTDNEFNSDNCVNSVKGTGQNTNLATLTGREIFQNILDLFVKNCNDVQVLSVLIGSFSGRYMAGRAQEMISIISSTTCYSGSVGMTDGRSDCSKSEKEGKEWENKIDSSTSEKERERGKQREGEKESKGSAQDRQCDALSVLGQQLTPYPPPGDVRRRILRDVWGIVDCTDSLSTYLQCAKPWISFAQANCTYVRTCNFITDVCVCVCMCHYVCVCMCTCEYMCMCV